MNNEPSKIKTWILIVLSLLMIIVIGLTVGGREKVSSLENFIGNVVRPVQGTITKISYYISEQTYPIRHVFKLSEENAKLKEELMHVRGQLIQQTILQEEYKDLKALRRAQNYARRNSLENNISAEVIARDVGNFYTMFTVNAGLEKGVRKNSMVYDSNGFIGQVYECGKDWAKVITIIHSSGSVSFKILDAFRTHEGVVSGKGVDELSGYLFDEDSDIRVGDKIMTTGVGIYPRGVVIGTVTEVNKDGKTLLPRIKVEPAVNFKRINRVQIIPPFDIYKDEQDEG